MWTAIIYKIFISLYHMRWKDEQFPPPHLEKLIFTVRILFAYYIHASYYQFGVL